MLTAPPLADPLATSTSFDCHAVRVEPTLRQILIAETLELVVFALQENMKPLTVVAAVALMAKASTTTLVALASPT